MLLPTAFWLRCGRVDPPVGGAGRSGCPAWYRLSGAGKAGSGPHGEPTQKASPALGHALTLCCQSRASAQPTPTHRWLGTLQEQHEEPHNNRNANRPSFPPSDLGLPVAIIPTQTWGSDPQARLPLRPGALGTLTVPCTQRPRSPPDHGLARLTEDVRSEGGLSGGRKSKKGCKPQVCGIGARGEETGKFLLWSDPPPRGPEATADLPQPTMVYQ